MFMVSRRIIFSSSSRAVSTDIQLPCVVVKPCPGGQAELRIFRSHQLLDLGAANFAPPNGFEQVIGVCLHLQRKPAQFRG